MVRPSHPPKKYAREEDRESTQVWDSDDVGEREERATEKSAGEIKGDTKDDAILTDQTI